MMPGSHQRPLLILRQAIRWKIQIEGTEWKFDRHSCAHVTAQEKKIFLFLHEHVVISIVKVLRFKPLKSCRASTMALKHVFK